MIPPNTFDPLTWNKISELYDCFFPRQYQVDLLPNEALLLNKFLTKVRSEQSLDCSFKPIVILNTLYFYNTTICKHMLQSSIYWMKIAFLEKELEFKPYIDIEFKIEYILYNIGFYNFYYINKCITCDNVNRDIHICKNYKCKTCKNKKDNTISNDRKNIRENAYVKIRKAIRSGAVKRLYICEVCSIKCTTDGHHWKGYDNPLDVLWLCRNCHRKSEKYKNYTKEELINSINKESEGDIRFKELCDSIKIY